MAVRSSMSDLIAKVRLFIGDPSGGSQQFSDQQIQDQLDRNRTDVRYEELTPLVTLSPSAIQYVDYYSRYGYWESDYTLLGPDYSTLTALTAELLLDTAHFTFTASGSGQYPPVWLAGKTYDVYAASADLLEMWAALLARAFAFEQDRASYQRNQQSPALQRMAEIYRRQARPKAIHMVRDDVNLEDDARRAALGPVSSGVRFITGD
jgi:hypothetical protein